MTWKLDHVSEEKFAMGPWDSDDAAGYRDPTDTNVNRVIYCLPITALCFVKHTSREVLPGDLSSATDFTFKDQWLVK